MTAIYNIHNINVLPSYIYYITDMVACFIEAVNQSHTYYFIEAVNQCHTYYKTR